MYVKTYLKSCIFLADSCVHFLNGKKSPRRAWATVTLEGAATSRSTSHLHGNCSRRTKNQAGEGWISKHAVGSLCGHTLGSVEVEMPSSCRGKASCGEHKQEGTPNLGTLTSACLPSHKLLLPKKARRTSKRRASQLIVPHPPTWTIHCHKKRGWGKLRACLS